MFQSNRSPRTAMRPPLTAAILASIAVASVALQPALGAVIENTKDFVGKAQAKSPDNKYRAQLDFKDVLPLAAPTADELLTLGKAYNKPNGPKWTFSKGAAAPGKFRVLEHQAFATNDTFGANLSVVYDDGAAAARKDYSWIQLITGDNWSKNGKYTKNDSRFSNTPFYSNYTPEDLPTLLTPLGFRNTNAIWNNSTDYPEQRIQNPAGGGKAPAGDLLFVDEPLINDATFADFKSGYGHISFHLYLVSFTWNDKAGNGAKGEITVHDGMSWGVTVVPAPTPVAMLGLVAGPCLARRRRQGRNELSVRPNS